MPQNTIQRPSPERPIYAGNGQDARRTRKARTQGRRAQRQFKLEVRLAR